MKGKLFPRFGNAPQNSDHQLKSNLSYNIINIVSKIGEENEEEIWS